MRELLSRLNFMGFQFEGTPEACLPGMHCTHPLTTFPHPTRLLATACIAVLSAPWYLTPMIHFSALQRGLQADTPMDPKAADVLAAFRQANPFSHNLPLPPGCRKKPSRYILEAPPTPFTQLGTEQGLVSPLAAPPTTAQQPAKASAAPSRPEPSSTTQAGQSPEAAGPATPSPAKPPMAPLSSPFAGAASDAPLEPGIRLDEGERRSLSGQEATSIRADSAGASSSGALGGDSPFPLPAAVASR